MAEENEACLQAIESALSRRCRRGAALDLKATVLTRIGRREPALAACDEPALGMDQAPLRARRAWVLKEFGDADEALAALRSVTENFPDHAWAWEQLTEWHAAAGRHDEAMIAAKQLVRLSPLSAVSFGYLGDAAYQAKDYDGAREALVRAATLDPHYLFAGSLLSRMAVERSLPEVARQALKLQGGVLPLASRQLWQLRVALAARNLAQVRTDLAALQAVPEVEPGLLEVAREELLRVAPLAGVDFLKELAWAPKSQPEALAMWLRSAKPESTAVLVLRIVWLCLRGRPTAGPAVRELFDCLGDRASALAVLWALLWLGWFGRRDLQVWGKIGYALTATRLYLLGGLWLSDWRSRPEAEPWMLFNKRVCDLQWHRLGSARRVTLAALRRPADATLLRHLVFAGYLGAIEGDRATALGFIEHLDDRPLEPYERWLLGTARLLLRWDAGAAAERPLVFEELRLHLLTFKRHLLAPAGAGTVVRLAFIGALRRQLSFSLLLPALKPFLLASLPALFVGLQVDASLGLYMGAITFAGWSVLGRFIRIR